MKNEEMLNLLSELDDRFVDEAGVQNADELKKLNIRNKKYKRRIVTLVCAAILLTVAMLWLFVPYRTTPRNMKMFQFSQYYELICEINEMTFEKKPFYNNFDKITAFFSQDKIGYYGGSYYQNSANKVNDESISYSPTMPDQQYVEATDNQVLGVIESDHIKMSDKYVYYHFGKTIYVFSIAKEETVCVGTYSLREGALDYKECEMYLSDDCKKLTVIGPRDSGKKHIKDTLIISLDVTDPANIEEVTRTILSGRYVTSRKIGDIITVITNFSVNSDPSFWNKKDYLPYYKSKGNFTEYVPMDNIVCPENPTTLRYAVVYALGEKDLTVIDSQAYFSYFAGAYANLESLYLIRYNNSYVMDDAKSYRWEKKTEISKLGYDGGKLDHKGCFVVNGYVKDQYSMDEYNGILRIVTDFQNASLYCVNAETFETVAVVENFAPDEEDVKSVRFDREKAYVCTALKQYKLEETVLDPVFLFDLSDINNITYKDTGTIPGFSTSLVNMGDGYFLGIGVGETEDTLKLEIYKESDDGVVSVCQYTVEKCEFSSDYKSYYINRELGLIGFSVIYDEDTLYGMYRLNERSRYIMVAFNKEKECFKQYCNEHLLPWSDPDYVRGFYLDGYCYAFANSPEAIVVKKLNMS